MTHFDFATGKLTITDRIYNLILTQISDGVFAEGEKLPSESELCKMYSASRISVRSALQRLEAIGLIETFHGKGSFVKPRSVGNREEDTLHEIVQGEENYEAFWQFRQVLGDKAMELFALRATEQDFETLEQLVDDMIDAESAEDVTRISAMFFMYIYQHCGNYFIAHAFTEYKEIFSAYFLDVQKNRRQTKAALVRWCGRIIDYLRERETQPISATILEENLLYFRSSGEKEENE